MTYPGGGSQPPIIPPHPISPIPAALPPHVVAPPPPKKRRAGLVVGLVLAVLVLVIGAGVIGAAIATGGKSSAGPSPTSSRAATTGTAVLTLNTPAQVIAALSHAGLACGTETPVSNPANGAFTMSQCGDNLVISSYANPTAAAAARDALSSQMKSLGISGYAVLFGNWLINAGTDLGYAQKVAGLFHGVVTPIGGPKPSPAKPAVPTIDDGTWTVGVDFPAGTYATTGVAGSTCYWKISTTGSNGSDIVDNHIGGGHLRVTLKAGQDFETERCGSWSKVG